MSTANDATTDLPAETALADAAPPQDDGERKKAYWERLRKFARANGLNRNQAYQWATQTVDRLWVEPQSAAIESPTNNETIASQQPADGDNSLEKEAGDTANLPADAETTDSDEPMAVESSRASDEPAVIGLGDIPAHWNLPPNASLSAEIQWVQANRMRCVLEKGDRVQVDLSKAMSPAPSYAALSWLETSIRAYTKFVDVAAKATAQLDDERAHIRREHLAIEEVRSLLAEMLGDE